jgi:hypothetical protein
MDNKTLTIQEVGTTFVHRHWYEVTSAGWGGASGVQAFGPGPATPNAQFLVQVGDANGDKSVLNSDASVVFAHVPCATNCGDNNRSDINGDKTVLNSDASVVFSKVPSVAVTFDRLQEPSLGAAPAGGR